MRTVRDSFSHALLHAAPDYCLLSYNQSPLQAPHDGADVSSSSSEGSSSSSSSSAGVSCGVQGEVWSRESGADVNQVRIQLSGPGAAFLCQLLVIGQWR
jgi:hypothetical protein